MKVNQHFKYLKYTKHLINKIFIEQLWKLSGTTLVNRAHKWNSDDTWLLKPTEANNYYIENMSENKVLGIQDDQVDLVQACTKELWHKGEPNREGYFTLTSSSSEKALTAVSANCLEIKGKIIFIAFLVVYRTPNFIPFHS